MAEPAPRRREFAAPDAYIRLSTLETAAIAQLVDLARRASPIALLFSGSHRAIVAETAASAHASRP